MMTKELYQKLIADHPDLKDILYRLLTEEQKQQQNTPETQLTDCTV